MSTPATYGDYRSVPDRDVEDGAVDHNHDDLAPPTRWERVRDTTTHIINVLFIPLLVVLSVVIIVTLAILLAVRPHTGTPGTTPTHPGAPITIPPGAHGGKWDQVKLPEFIRPIHYDLDFATLIDGEFNSTFEGHVVIRLNVTQATDFVVVHAVELNLTDVTIADSSKADQPALAPIRHEIHTGKQYHVFVFPETLAPADTYLLRVPYAGTLTRDLRGYYLAKYADPATGDAKWLATTQFEPTDARRAFPCFDQPDHKATFAITMHTQPQFHALSNMKLVETDMSIPNEDQDFTKNPRAKSYKFAPTPKMSTYLIAFIVSEFEPTGATTKRGVSVAVWTQPGQTHMGTYAAKAAAEILDFYEELLQIEYPLPKLDLIAVPDFAAGAMENWGLVTYRDTALLIGPSSAPNNRQRVATVIAHELAHQWFGNFVTMKWWDDLWLNEGFATFMEFLGANATEPTFELDAQFYRSEQVRAQLADASVHTHPIHANVADPAEIETLFDAISYAKGGSILRMVQHHLESNGHSFFAGVTKYLRAHAYGNAESKDLWTALSTPEIDVNALVAAWIHEPGYPIVTVEQVNATHLKLSQERFLNFGADKPKAHVNWQIPFSFAIYSNRTGTPEPLGHEHTVLLTESETIVALEGAALAPLAKKEHRFIKPNLGQYGLYRFAIPEAMTETAAEWLVQAPTFLAPLDRAGLIEDSLAAVVAGRTEKLAAALNLFQFLSAEETYPVWGAALSRLGGVHALIRLDPELVAYRQVVTRLLDAAVERIGWTETNEDESTWHVRALLRTELLGFASSIGHEPTIAMAKSLFKKMVKHVPVDAGLDVITKKLKIVPALVPVVVNTAVRTGGDNEYLSVEARFRAAKLINDALVFLTALSTAQAPHLVARSAALALSPAVRSQDTSRFLAQTAGSAVSSTLVFDYLREHWDAYLAQFGQGGAFSSGVEIWETIAGNAYSTAARDRVEAVGKELDANFKQGVAKGLESATAAAKWRAVYASQVVAWAHARLGEVAVAVE
ncbi:hypothetical protein AMAG_15025 [Allomyces macrogynus ATCC 38327]|uniref:Aminopeptidase n=1 Tax=Allomyces macrogynus (strain ATCC 38327) TaxID=578462 RepID=A0A0L0T881_ALLM3|nr:hypothetical protein AMAG_15025 [Allomyces macrogynus ATCC 38327]|eukprot:KNE70935.1 hypothetical protein AMAG_15025 [Allomyces macrogynus ATCC 38327]